MNGRVAKDEKGRKRREKSRDILATHPRGLSACQLKKKTSAILEQRVTGNPCYI